MSSGADTPFAALLADLGAGARERALGLAFASLEHLLRQQSWARERLRAHAGGTIRIGLDTTAVPGLARADLLATIDSGGLLRRAEAGAEPAVTVHLRPSVDAAFEMLRSGSESAARHVRVEGDAALAATIGELARHLRWDAEEDLSRITGDVVAHRIGRLIEGGLEQLRDAGGRTRSAAQRFVADDQTLLATGRLARELAAAVQALEARVTALESRAHPARAGR